MATTHLPPPDANDVDDHMAMSRRFIDHARDELNRGNRLQASEKVWGAAAHALKAIGVQRGWRHRSHGNIFDVGEHLGKEFDRVDEFQSRLNTADSMHQNFYENNRREDAIRLAIDEVEKLVDDLDVVRTSPPRPFTVANDVDSERIAHLLGLRGSERPAIGAHSNIGFSQTHPQTHPDG